MSEIPQDRSWAKKFLDAFRGVKVGVRGQNSFIVHVIAGALVIAVAALLQVSLWEWCALILCIALVVTAEMFNSALESMAKSITDQPDPRLADALDISSAAVLIASIGATVVGLIIFGSHLGARMGLW
jgi:diacylglycerol kinase